MNPVPPSTEAHRSAGKARQLMVRDAIGAHAFEELGLSPMLAVRAGGASVSGMRWPCS